MNSNTRVAGLVALLVLLISAVVYFLTLTPTVPFWDSGEFIGVSTILGIPHPPGTPFYVLVGRMATLVPLGSIAQRVNGLSALAAALCVFLTYLSILRIARAAQGGERQPWHEWAAIAGAACVPAGASVTLTAGGHDLAVEVTDRAGNVTRSATVHVTAANCTTATCNDGDACTSACTAPACGGCSRSRCANR